MRKTVPKYGWHSETEGCDTENCVRPKIAREIKIASKTIFAISCNGCQKTFETDKSRYNSAIKRGRKKFYCSNSCLGKSQRANSNNHTCQQCGTDFHRQVKKGQVPKYCSEDCYLKSQGKQLRAVQDFKCQQCGENFTRKFDPRIEHKFCSSDCSNLFRKGLAFLPLPKRRKGTARYCPSCKKHEIFNSEKTCEECRFKASFGKNITTDYDSVTLADLRKSYSVEQYHAKIRGNARSIYKLNRGKMECKQCGYDKHVDICHIVDLKEFDKNTTVSHVNEIKNLVALCKNHHWEFDNPESSINVALPSPIKNKNNITLAELKLTFKDKASTRIRADSRFTFIQSKQPLTCEECGYSKRVDICHIKAVKTFSENSIISEINALENLKALCPKHHWEFDHQS